jgi:hypothetical protein
MIKIKGLHPGTSLSNLISGAISIILDGLLLLALLLTIVIIEMVSH